MWSIETLNDAVDDELRSLPLDVAARLSRYLKLVEQHGPSALPPKAVKHLEDRLWELRLTGRDGIARVIYVTAVERRLILLRAFVKKTQKTPLRDLDVARARAKLVQ